jgi:hypothetical protein
MELAGSTLARMRVVVAVALAWCVIACAASQAAPGVTVEPAKVYRAAPTFAVHVAGEGSWRTDYHSEPPNEGGDHDTNDAHDTSTQRWNLVYRDPLTIPQCRGSAMAGRTCHAVTGLTGGRGKTVLKATVDHVHVDGLYDDLDTQEACAIHRRHPNAKEPAALAVELPVENHKLALTVHNPISESLAEFPQACPGHSDSLDGLADNYYAPGFSFDEGYGPEPWFTSRTVRLPLRSVHRAKRIEIALSGAPAGIPPADCAVHDPAVERCATAGTWSGVLELELVR